MAENKEFHGHWQNIKWTCPKNPNKESVPYVTYRGRRFNVSDFTNWGGMGEHYTYQDGYTVYYLEVEDGGERARVTYCPPSW